MKLFYFLCCIIGTILPMSQFVPWVFENGFNIPFLISQIIENPISIFAWYDVLVSAIVLIVFIVMENKRYKIRYAWVSLLGLCVGVSLALPLFLLIREYHIDNNKK